MTIKAAMTFVALMSLSSGAEAGFLDDLFGPDPAPQAAAQVTAHPRSSGRKVSAVAPNERVKSDLRFMTERHSRPLKVAHEDTNQSSAGSKPVQAALCAPEGTEVPTSPTSQLLIDKTLRSGDVLVTDKGVQVFRGQKACPHDATSFVAISNVGMSKSRRSVLLAIEDAMNRPNGYEMTAHLKH